MPRSLASAVLPLGAYRMSLHIPGTARPIHKLRRATARWHIRDFTCAEASYIFDKKHCILSDQSVACGFSSSFCAHWGHELQVSQGRRQRRHLATHFITTLVFHSGCGEGNFILSLSIPIGGAITGLPNTDPSKWSNNPRNASRY